MHIMRTKTNYRMSYYGSALHTVIYHIIVSPSTREPYWTRALGPILQQIDIKKRHGNRTLVKIKMHAINIWYGMVW